MDRRTNPSGSSTPTPGHEGAITCGYILPQPMGPMLTILAAVRGRSITMSALNRGPGHIAHDPHSTADSQPEAQNWEEREDWGTVAKGLSEEPPVHMFGSDTVGEDAHDIVHQGTSRGGCR